MNLVIVSDGASHNNGGECGVAFIAYDKESGDKIHYTSASIGIGSNTKAEYAAMMLAIEWAINWAKDKDFRPDIIFLSDSNLVVSHVDGSFKAKTAETSEWRDQVRSLLLKLSAYSDWKIEHAPREYTQAVDELARSAAKGTVEKTFEKKYPFLKR